jgi:tetratricopeptide (TPR) repeat protein
MHTWHIGKKWKRLYTRAIQLEGTTKELNTDLAWCYFGRGRAKKMQQKYQSAIEDFEQSLEVGGDAFINGSGGAGYAPTDIYIFEARTYEALEDYKNAINCYNLFGAFTGKHDAVEADIVRLNKLLAG